MFLVIDGNRFAVEYDQVQNIVHDYVAAKKLLISGYRVDGMIYRYDILDRMKSAEEIEILTQTVAEYLSDVLRELNSYDTSVDKILLGVIKKLYVNPEDSDIANVGQVLEFNTRIVDLYRQVHALLEIAPTEPNKTVMIDTLVSTDLMDSIQNRDFVNVADIISFELFPLIRELMDELQEKIQHVILPAAE